VIFRVTDFPFPLATHVTQQVSDNILRCSPSPQPFPLVSDYLTWSKQELILKRRAKTNLQDFES
jgi:hypothetical protein